MDNTIIIIIENTMDNNGDYALNLGNSNYYNIISDKIK
jgi:hypothetical protein